MTVSPIPLIDGKTVADPRRGRLLADADELLDGREGPRQQRSSRLADMADAEREDEAVEFGFAPRIDGGNKLVEAFVGALLR